jgi:hypothetical protein
MTVRVVNASTEQQLDDAFASAKKFDAGGLVVVGEPFLTAGVTGSSH